MDVRLRMTMKLWESVMIIVAVHLLSCTNGSSHDCSIWHSTAVSCINKNLTAIPNWIPSNVSEIDLSRNPFLKLQEDSFARFTNLQTLQLRRCNINKPLNLPTSLQNIDLSFNPLLHVQEDYFARFTNLQTLQVRRCNINKPLNLPTSLQNIDLSFNPLLHLQEDYFARFTNLQTLQLRRCNINKPLKLPTSLRNIDLSFNPLLHLQEDYFVRFTNLQSLKLHRCSLNLPLQLPQNLHTIDLAGNSFSLENVAAMFKRIQESRIVSIHMGANNLVLDGKLSVFPKSVKLLTLNNNILRKIKADDFKGFSHLTHLDLSNNSLHSIVTGAFDHLKELNNITLSDNHIADLPKRLFQHNPKVSNIKLENNHLQDIPDLSGIRSLGVLALSRNRIKTVNCCNFGVWRIYDFRLASNKIHSFNFSGLAYSILDISNNHISSIVQGSFGEKSNISTLILQRNNITSLTRSCFQGIHFIGELHLQSNKLKWIEKGTFRNMSIEKLFLFNNSLTAMDGVMEGMKKQPNLLLLFGNPHISFMRASDYENMMAGSEIYIDCRSIKTFSSPFIMKAKLICSPSKELVIESYASGLEGNGFACKGRSQKKCYPCQPGEYDAAMYHKGQHCIPCPYGESYQDQLASIGCKKCPVGQYVPPEKGPGTRSLDCLTCPKGTNTNNSAGYRACPCLPGYSRTYRFGACKKCAQDGFQCKRDYPELRQGYWMSWDNSETCRDSFKSFMSNLDTKDDTYDRKANYFNCTLPIAHKCPIAKSCKGGVDATCYKGYSGALCAVCDSGYMKQFNKCVKCPSPVVSVVECIAYFLSFVILCWLMSKLKNITLAGNDNEKDERTFADLIQSSLKILMGFYQVLVRIINAFSSIQWPSTLTHAVKVFEFIELSVLRIPSLHCIRSDWRLNAIGEFWISLIAMVVIPFLILVYCSLKAAISFFCISRENFRQKRMISLKNCFQSIVLFYFATYPFISTKVFHVLPGSCHTLCTVKKDSHCLNKISYLRNDYSVECPHASGDRSFNFIYAYVSLLLPIGLPCLLLYLLWRFAPKDHTGSQPQRHLNTECEDSQENEEQWHLERDEYNESPADSEVANGEEISVAAFALKMTYGNYKTSCWYWEFIEMMRKLLMVVASSFLLQNVKIGLYSNILLSIVFVVLHAKKWPMKDSFDNYMQLLALVSVTVNLCYSVTKASKIGDADIIDNKKDVFGLGLMLVCLNSLVVILIVGRFVKEVVVKLTQKYCADCCSLGCSFQCCDLQRSGNQSQELLL